MATFGYTGTGDGTAYPNGNDAIGTAFTLTEAGTVTSISVYIRAQSGTGNVQCAIYGGDIRAGYGPATLQGSSPSVAIDTNYAWKICTLSSPAVLAAGDYVLFYNTDVPAMITRLNGGPSGCGRNINPAQTFNTWDANEYLNGLGDYEQSIYATYTTGGATELDHTVKPSGGDFTTLADALSHLASSHSDLVSSDQYAVIAISGSWGASDTAAVSCSGVTTNATHYIKITTDAANRASLTWDVTKYHLSVSNAVSFLQANDFVILDGLQISSTVMSADNQNPLKIYKASWGTGATTTVIDCLIKGASSATYIQKGIDDEGATTNILNTCVYNINTTKAGSVGIAAAPTTATNIYSTTVVGGTTGILRTSGTCTAKNCYVGTAGAGGCYSGTIAMTTCASSDTTGSAAGLRNIAVSTTADSTHAGFINVSSGSENFHIKAGSPLIGTGTDTHGESSPLNFTVDIDGDTRG